MEVVRCTKVVRFSEGPLLEVLLYLDFALDVINHTVSITCMDERTNVTF